MEGDELEEFGEGKREVSMSQAIRILQKNGYDIDLVY